MQNKVIKNLWRLFKDQFRVFVQIIRIIQFPDVNFVGRISLKQCEFEGANTVFEGVRLYNVGVGKYTYISRGCTIQNTRIGRFCSVGPNCQIGLGKHPSDRLSTYPGLYGGRAYGSTKFVDGLTDFEEFEEIIIGHDVWIGSSVIIRDGINIGDGCIIGAGAVVTKSLPPYSIAVGSPAKIIRTRFDEDEIERLLDIRWWEFSEEELIKLANADFKESINKNSNPL